MSYIYHKLCRHEEALEVASSGINYCLDNRDYIGLNHLYFRKGIAKLELKHDDYMEFLRKAVYQCEVLGQQELENMMVRNCKKVYNIKL